MGQMTKMKALSLKIASIVMTAMGIYTLVISLLWIFLTEVGFVSDFAAFTGQTWLEYLASAPKPAELYIITKKLIGVQMLPTSILIILITQKSYSKAEKWSRYTLLVAGTATWGSLIGYRIAIGYFGFDTPLRAASSMTPIVGLVLTLIGSTLPAKLILGKPAQSSSS